MPKKLPHNPTPFDSLDRPVLVLPDGTSYLVNWAEEARVPATYEELEEEIERAPQRLAFWGALRAKANQSLRYNVQEVRSTLSAIESGVREHLRRELASYLSDREIRNHADVHPDLEAARAAESDAQYTAEVIETLYEVHLRRLYVLENKLRRLSREA